MKWALANPGNPDYEFFMRLIRLRKSRRALRIGDFAALDTTHLLAYTRSTAALRDFTLIAINPSSKKVQESFTTRNGQLMSWGELEDGLSGRRIRSINGFIDLEMAPYSVAVFAPVVDHNAGYSPYDRVPK